MSKILALNRDLNTCISPVKSIPYYPTLLPGVWPPLMCLDHHDPVTGLELPWEPIGPEVPVTVDAPSPDPGHLLHQKSHPGVASAREGG